MIFVIIFFAIGIFYFVYSQSRQETKTNTDVILVRDDPLWYYNQPYYYGRSFPNKHFRHHSRPRSRPRPHPRHR